MKKITNFLVAAVAVLGIGFALFAPNVASAVDFTQGGDCDDSSVKSAGAAKVAACAACQADSAATAFEPTTGKCTTTSTGSGDLNSIIHTVINVLLFIIGTLSVIMIIYAGIRYVISRGKDDEVKGAKNTILYAVVGLVISMIAFAIVQFVFSSIK